MRLRRLVLLLLALLLCGPAPGRLLRAEEAPPEDGLPDAEVKRLSKDLTARAKTWWGNRKKLAVTCPECRGKGKVRWQGGRTGPLVACPKCEARMVYVDQDRYQICHYEMHSPAFRLQEGIVERLMDEYEAARRGKPLPDVVKKYRIKAVEIVDATHGIVHVKKNREGVARPQRWILAQDAGEDPTWYLYDAPADGSWPGDEDEAPPTQKPEPPERTTPRPVPRQPARQEPAPPPPRARPPTAQDRDEIAASKALVKRWGEERNEWMARVIAIELGLDEVEGHEEKIANARTFVGEIKGWMEEAKPFYERAQEDVEEKGLGILLADRLKVNILHVRAHRRLELVEKMLVVIVPGLGK